MARRLHKTLVDYLVIAISPALIITLIGSLVFFLLEVFYRGQHGLRLHVVFGLFVLGMVLVGRIAIEEGLERAHLFAVPLGFVTFLALCKYVQFQVGPWGGLSTIINLGLIALIWWCAQKLTWDCTLIDENQRDTGRGLLESAGLDGPATAGSQPNVEEEQELQPEGATSPQAAAFGWWRRFVEHQRRPHAPGVWVVYFSLAALPLFGIGQTFVPPDGRRHAFNLLFIYVASGLGLLLTTSFLGLRRYLRQRRVEMPAPMTGLWLVIGCSLIVVLLVFVDFLPRPNAEYSISALPFTIVSPDRRPSRSAPGKDGVEDKEGRSATKSAAEKRQSDESPQDEMDAETSDGSKDPGEESANESPKKSATSTRPAKDPTGNLDRRAPSRSPSRLGSGLAWFAKSWKWVFYAAIGLLAAWWIWRSRTELLAGLRDLLQGWREFWQRLFGRGRKTAHSADVAQQTPNQPLPRPLADFADPFAAGIAGHYRPDDLVRYSFEALEAWAREHDCPRGPEQTPHEFARNVGDHAPSLSPHAQRLAELYCRVAYAPGTLPAKGADPLRQLWASLRQGETAVRANVGKRG